MVYVAVLVGAAAISHFPSVSSSLRQYRIIPIVSANRAVCARVYETETNNTTKKIKRRTKLFHQHLSSIRNKRMAWMAVQPFTI